MEVSLRSRLGGRRAISWQAVVIGDLLIIVLATALAAVTASAQPPIEAATKVFAITTATAMVVAAYTAVMHLTLFRDRSRKPVPVSVAVAFHLSIGVLFLVGFALGAAVLDAAELGGSLPFSIAVLMGGLLVCLPTSLLLDHSDRYRAARQQLTLQLTHHERLRISEWSMRQTLRSIASMIEDRRLGNEVTERLDVLELSRDTRLPTSAWWQASQTHHQGGHPAGPESPLLESSATASRVDFTSVISNLIAREFPVVRWSQEIPTPRRSALPAPAFAFLLVLFTVWLFLAPLLPSSFALPIATTAAVGTYLIVAVQRARSVEPRPILAALGACVWGAVSAAVWMIAFREVTGSAPATLPIISALTGAGVAVAMFIAIWISTVVAARNQQLETLQEAIVERRNESEAIFASLTSIVTLMSEAPPLVDSAAIAACATGLQRVQRERDLVHARRIIEWTDSILAAPGVLRPVSLTGRIDEVVRPWRALADIKVECPTTVDDSALVDDVIAIIDEAVRNACRHGEAQTISIDVSADAASNVCIEIKDDGSGPGEGAAGMGLERFRVLGSAGFDISPRSPGPGTRVLVRLAPTGTT